MTFAPATSRAGKALAVSLGTIWLIVCLAALPARDAFARHAPAQDMDGAVV